jgi:hypothetical protein
LHNQVQKALDNVSTADEAFLRMDADQSGALDGEEIAHALHVAAAVPSTDSGWMQKFAAQLIDLYDLNGDGVMDRSEYQHMVDDMAALRDQQRQ